MGVTIEVVDGDKFSLLYSVEQRVLLVRLRFSGRVPRLGFIFVGYFSKQLIILQFEILLIQVVCRPIRVSLLQRQPSILDGRRPIIFVGWLIVEGWSLFQRSPLFG